MAVPTSFSVCPSCLCRHPGWNYLERFPEAFQNILTNYHPLTYHGYVRSRKKVNWRRVTVVCLRHYGTQLASNSNRIFCIFRHYIYFIWCLLTSVTNWDQRLFYSEACLVIFSSKRFTCTFMTWPSLEFLSTSQEYFFCLLVSGYYLCRKFFLVSHVYLMITCQYSSVILAFS